MNIEKIAELLEISVPAKNEKAIQEWKNWYEGYDPDFHDYKMNNGQGSTVQRKRYSLRLAKTIAEAYADVIYNPETQITLGDEDKQNWWNEISERLDFTNNMNNLVELYFALGMGALSVYTDTKGKAQVDFHDNEQIYPLEYDNDDIVSCMFISQYDETTVYVSLHHLQDDDTYLIENKFIDVTNEDKPTLTTIEGIADEVYSDIKMFQVFKPAIANNLEIGSAEGISIYANAIDELKAVDLMYDAFVNDVVLGKRRIFVKDSMVSFGEDGQAPKINLNDDAFYVMDGDSVNDDETFIKVSAEPLHTENLIKALNKAKNELASKCGLGDNYFTEQQSDKYTNTAEILSSNSKFYKTRQKHASKVETGLINIVKALFYADSGILLDDTISVQFDDSIIHDEAQQLANDIMLYNLGVYSEIYLIMQHQGMTREEATDFYNQMQVDKGLTEEIPLESEIEIVEDEV